MTPKQIQLLKKCIYKLRTADSIDEELVEVGSINGVDPRTAKSLVDAELLVYDFPSWANEITHDHVRFPTLKDISNG